MVVQHNMSAINANRYFGINNSKLSKSLEKLSSGYAINRAGDNAAGLAVSEKMRSQIAGINQGVKNAQDGISMVQTYEGALTETDSILQRMKTLATQAANGTYQNEVDREAIQLEFNQLNDELDQIADTDFNGVVALNGGVMADGLTQVEGKFDYSLKEEQTNAAQAAELKAAQDAADTKIAAAQTDVDTAQAELDALGAKDISLNGSTSNGWNTVDDKAYNKTVADAVWKALSLTDDAGNVDTSKVSEINVTFIKKDDGTWEIRDGYDNNNNTLNKTDLGNAFKSITNRADEKNKGLGGFEVTVGSGTATGKVNAIFDDKNAKAGDTVTLKFTNAPDSIYAPSNAGFADNSVKYTVTGVTGSVSSDMVSVTATKAAKNVEVIIKDDSMTADNKALLDNIFGDATNGKLEVNYSQKDGNIGSSDGVANTAITAADIKLGGVSIGDVGTTGKSVAIGGKNYWIAFDNANPTAITVSAVNTTGGTAAKGTDLFKINLDTNVKNKDNSFAAIKMEGQLKADTYDYAVATGIDASASKDKTLNNSVEIQAATDKLNAKLKVLEEAKAAKPMSVDDLFEGVSKSDALNQATAPLTYQNHIMLQTGARSKDLVDFTFKYSSDGIGDLKANLDCSSREGGLNTQNLSLATQEEANNAIDKIDNALSKVSMVRGTFGAVQNRLEHKIDNLNTTSENLTSAESRIRDTNMAEEMMNFTKNQILSQASQSMLAQANQLPQGVLSLLQ